MDFHLVIPAYKESERLPGFLPGLAKAMDALSATVNICVVDDGSGKSEQEAVVKLCNKLRAEFRSVGEPLLLPENLGKGGAIRAGWNANSDATWLAFVDADGAIPPEEVCRLFEIAKSAGPSVAIFGSRIRMLGRKIERSTARHLTGRIFAAIVGTMVSHSVYDSQCGLKIIPAAAYKTVASRLQESGFSFDVELLAALLSAGIPVLEAPLDWYDKSGSKVSLFRDSIHMATAAWRIRKRFKTWTL